MDAPWQIQMLGSLQAISSERSVARFRTQMTAALFAYLAYHLDRPHPRDSLLELLWPEDELGVARNKLRQALTSLRYQLEPPGVPRGSVIMADRTAVQLNPAACATDVALFEAALRDARRTSRPIERTLRLIEAVDLYRGELLPGHIQSWVTLERVRLGEVFQQAVDELIVRLEEAGDLTRAREYARRAVTADPLREEAQHVLIRLLAAAGEGTAAARQYQELERLLAETVGTEPSTATRRLIEELWIPSRTGSAGSSRGVVTESRSTASAAQPGPATAWSRGMVTLLVAEVIDTTVPADGPGQRELLPSDPAAILGLLRPLLCGREGQEVQCGGQTIVVGFERPSDALAAAVEGHRAVGRAQWTDVAAGRRERGVAAIGAGEGADDPGSGPLAYRLLHPAYRLRLGLHTGEVAPGDELPRSDVCRHATRLLLAAQPGQILLSEKCGVLLQDRSEPGIEIRDLGRYRLTELDRPERLFEVAGRVMGAEPLPPPRALPEHSGQLPLQFTRFFGREAEIAHLIELLAPGGEHGSPCRLVTLTGAGGAGKTRLALEAAERLQGVFRGAVWFAALADLTDGSLIPDRLLDVLRLPRSPFHDPLTEIAAFLAQQPALLVIDNLEHLLSGAAGSLEALLEQAPGLRLLVTSRQRLDLPGEREVVVPPLPDPREQVYGAAACPDWQPLASDPDRELSLEALRELPSVQLFVDRAQAVRPDFQLNPANLAAVASLCARLEGIPLALELAAARVGILTPAQILARLERPFELLVNRRRGVVARHRSLWAALDWSYQLLPPSLQKLFARLSIFHGGWTLDAAEVVCGPTDAESRPGQHRTPCIDSLSRLRECSLIQADTLANGDICFHLLETVREFAAEQLGPEEREPLARRHAEYYLAVAEEAAPELVRGGQERWLQRLKRDQANLRAALAWMVDSGEAEAGLRLGAALDQFWNLTDHWSEGRAWLERLLSIPSQQPGTLARARALQAAAQMQVHLGDLRTAQARCEQSIALARALGDRRALLGAMNQHGDIHLWLYGPAAARLVHQEALSLAREQDDPWGTAVALRSLAGVLSWQGELQEARGLYVESVTHFRALGDEQNTADALVGLGYSAQLAGQWEGARALYEESLSIRRSLGHQRGIAWALNYLGSLSHSLMDVAMARRYYEESLCICRTVENPWGVAWSLHGLADVARVEGDRIAARALYEESLELHRRLGNRRSIAWALHDLGILDALDGDHEGGAARCRESLIVRHELKDRGAVAASLDGLAQLALTTGEPATAARLLGAARALRSAIGAAVPPVDQLRLDQLADEARTALGEARFEAALREGQVLSTDAAVELALTVGSLPK